MPYIVHPLPIADFYDRYEYQAEGDGDCLFHSLGFLFEQYRLPAPFEPAEIRTQVVAKLESELASDDTGTWAYDTMYKDAPSYIKALKKEGIWADANCVRAAALAFSVNIRVHLRFAPPEEYLVNSGPGLELSFRGNNHYNPLLPKVGDWPVKKVLQEKLLRPSGTGGSSPSSPRAVRLEMPNTIARGGCCEVKPMVARALRVPRWRIAPSGNAYYAPLEDGATELNFCIYPTLTGRRFWFAKPQDENYILDGTFTADRVYDLYAGSCVKSGRLIGTADTTYQRLFTFQEQAIYAQRALFNDGVAGVVGTIQMLTLRKGTVAKLAKSKTVIQVHDGWGFVKECLARELDATRIRDKIELLAPEANYQMFQWLDAGEDDLQAEDEVVDELAASGSDEGTHDESVGEEAAAVFYRLSPRWLQHLATINGAMAAHPLVHKLGIESQARHLRVRTTTGNPPLKQGVAMPVPGKHLVLPGRLDGVGRHSGNVAVFRHPGDRLNWVATQRGAVDEAQQKLVSEIEGIQYTLTGLANGKLAFYKGMAGVIADDDWPAEWGQTCLVLCNEDLKAHQEWETKKAVAAAKKSDERSTLQFDGCFVAIQWFAAGAMIGVPDWIQEELAGDYDGDIAILLSGDELPKTYAYIQKKSAEAKPNPKLAKLFTPARPGDSRAPTIVKIYRSSALVGLWSNVTASVLAAPLAGATAVAEALHYGTRAKLLSRLSLGMKEGTDAFKTDVDVPASLGAALAIQKQLKSRGLLAPHTRMKRDQYVFRDADHLPRILSEHDVVAGDPWQQMFSVRADLRGIPVKLMRKLVPGLKLPVRPPLKPLLAYRTAPHVAGTVAELQAMWKIQQFADGVRSDPLLDHAGYVAAWRPLLETFCEQLGRDTVCRLAWHGLHHRKEASPDDWQRVYIVFWYFREEVETLIGTAPW